MCGMKLSVGAEMEACADQAGNLATTKIEKYNWQRTEYTDIA